MTKRKPKPLPDKLSDLLDLAVTDAIKIGKTPGYKLDMGAWHHRHKADGRTVCHVCMAGAVMAAELGVRRTESAGPSAMDDLHGEGVGMKLRAINAARAGEIGVALMWLGMSDRPAGLGMSDRPAGHDNAGRLIRSAYGTARGLRGRAPWRIYRKAAAMLREAGL